MQTYPFQDIISVQNASRIRPFRRQAVPSTNNDNTQSHTQQLTEKLFRAEPAHTPSSTMCVEHHRSWPRMRCGPINANRDGVPVAHNNWSVFLHPKPLLPQRLSYKSALHEPGVSLGVKAPRLRHLVCSGQEELGHAVFLPYLGHLLVRMPGGLARYAHRSKLGVCLWGNRHAIRCHLYTALHFGDRFISMGLWV